MIKAKSLIIFFLFFSLGFYYCFWMAFTIACIHDMIHPVDRGRPDPFVSSPHQHCRLTSRDENIAGWMHQIYYIYIYLCYDGNRTHNPLISQGILTWNSCTRLICAHPTYEYSLIPLFSCFLSRSTL